MSKFRFLDEGVRQQLLGDAGLFFIYCATRGLYDDEIDAVHNPHYVTEQKAAERVHLKYARNIREQLRHELKNEKRQLPREVDFYVVDQGDGSVGIAGSQSKVTTYIQDAEHLESVRDVLKKSFQQIHEFPIWIMTDEETEAEDDEPDAEQDA